MSIPTPTLQSMSSDSLRDQYLDTWDTLSSVKRLQIGGLCAPGGQLCDYDTDLFCARDIIDATERVRTGQFGAASADDLKRLVIHASHILEDGDTVVVLDAAAKPVYGSIVGEEPEGSNTYTIATSKTARLTRYITAIGVLRTV